MPDDQRVALALRVLDRRTALSQREQRKAAGEASAKARWGNEVIDADHAVTDEPAEKPKKPRIRTEVAKQAAVSERRVQGVAEIRREDPEAYQRIVSGQSTIREEKAALYKAHREAIKAKPRRRSMVPKVR